MGAGKSTEQKVKDKNEWMDNYRKKYNKTHGIKTKKVKAKPKKMTPIHLKGGLSTLKSSFTKLKAKPKKKK